MGQYEEALADLDRAIDLDPDDGAAAADRRAIYAEAQRLGVLLEWMGHAADPAASAAFLADHFQDLSDPPTVELLAANCDGQPADRQLWQHLGLLLLDDEAASGYKATQAGAPSPFQRAANLLDDGDLDRALAWSCLARAAEPGPGALLMGQVHLRRGDPDRAGEALATAANEMSPERVTEVLSAYDALLAVQPLEARRHAEHAEALRRAGRQVEAVAAYDRAISLAPDEPSLHFNKGDLLFGLSQLDDAQAEFLAVTRLWPADVLGAAVLLAAIVWPTDPEQAKQYFQSALSSPGELLTPFTRAYYRAIALAGLGRSDEAAAELMAAAETRTDRELELDDSDDKLFERFRNPPLPSLDTLRHILESIPSQITPGKQKSKPADTSAPRLPPQPPDAAEQNS